MQDLSEDVARQTAPWKPGQSWLVAGVQGIIALVISVFILANPAGVSDVIRFLIALVLLLIGLGHIVDGFRDPRIDVCGGIGVLCCLMFFFVGLYYVDDDGVW